MASMAEATATMVKNIEAATGRKIAEWIRAARGSGFAKHGEILKWLKEKHGMGHGYANYVAKAALAADDADDDSLVAAQFGGKKSSLRPLYEALVSAAATSVCGAASSSPCCRHRPPIGSMSGSS